VAKLITPPPRPQPIMQPGFQAQQEQTRIEGSISNRGKAAVDAVKTPLAVYRKQVNAAIGSRWYYYVRDPNKMSLISAGSARVSFFIDAQGQIRHHQFGEGQYEQAEKVIQQLLAEAGINDISHELVAVDARGVQPFLTHKLSRTVNATLTITPMDGAVELTAGGPAGL